MGVEGRVGEPFSFCFSRVLIFALVLVLVLAMVVVDVRWSFKVLSFEVGRADLQ